MCFVSMHSVLPLKQTLTAGLEGFYTSLEELMKESKQQALPLRWYTYLDIHKGKKASRKEPEVIAQIIMWLSSASVGSSLLVTYYKILNLWVKKVNGRKIKVKFGNLEVETSQLTEKQFGHLLSKIIEFKQASLNQENDIEQLSIGKDGNLSMYKIKHIPELLDDQELRHLISLQSAAQEELRKRSEEKNTPAGESTKLDQEDTLL